MGSIRLSPKHGVNPAIPVCFFCGENKNELILVGRLPGDEEAPRRAVWNMEPCDKCKGFMAQGVILISAKADSPDQRNPYRTGGWCVVKDDAIQRILNPDMAQQVLQQRVAFVPDEVWDAIGLPRE